MKKLISVTWVRVITSLCAGGVTHETFIAISDNPNRPRTGGDSLATLILILIYYMFFTWLNKKIGKVDEFKV
jgi:hypothetical protein